MRGGRSRAGPIPGSPRPALHGGAARGPHDSATPSPCGTTCSSTIKGTTHKPPKSPTTGKRPTIPYSIQVTSATTHARRPASV